MKTCFISAPVNVDLSVLRSVLRSKGIEAVLPFELEITGANFREQIEKAIRKADFLIAVLTGNIGNANVFFELGYAWAKRKRVVLIQSREVELPANLSGFAMLRAEPNDRQKLASLLDQFLNQEKPIKLRTQELEKTRPLSSRAKDLTDHLKNLGDRATHKEFENIILTAFRESGIQALAEPQSKDRRYDLALWLDELQYVVGNPVLVELKTRLTPASAKAVKRQFLERVDREVGKALLVVFLGGPAAPICAESIGSPLVLFIPVARLLSELEQRSVGDFVRAERNKLAHGV
jgi:nucleoside 2-deoxyribosyltransferase